MKKFIVFLSLIFIITTNFSKEMREQNHIIHHHFQEEPPSYSASQEEHETRIGNETLLDFPSTEISLENQKKCAGILHNQEENFFITLSDSKLITTSKPGLSNLITSLSQSPQQRLYSLFDYKINEGYLCTGSEKIIIIQINDHNYFQSATIPLSKRNKDKPANHCIEAFFNGDAKPNQCFTSTKDGKVRLWDYGKSTVEKLRTFVRIKSTPFAPCISFNRDKDLLLAQTALRSVAFFDQRIAKPIKTLSTQEPITALTHHNNNICLALTDETESKISCMDLRNYTTYNDSNSITATATHLSFNPLEGTFKLLVGTDEGELICINTLNDTFCSLATDLSPLKAHYDAITAVNWSAYGNPLSTSIDGFAKIWHKDITERMKPFSTYKSTITPLEQVDTPETSTARIEPFSPSHAIEERYHFQQLDEMPHK